MTVAQLREHLEWYGSEEEITVVVTDGEVESVSSDIAIRGSDSGRPILEVRLPPNTYIDESSNTCITGKC